MAKELRIKRVSSFIQSEISKIISQLRDERVKGIISVFDVELSKDLKYATVKLSIFSSEKEDIKSSIRSLIKAKSFIRRSLAKTLKTIHSPEIFFEFINLDESMKVFEILKEVKGDLEYDSK
ncbi:MAG: 30S ribosome-binding factor RbfA [Spirochaetia bacterium]|nr:30S ribosome-binding factor RbfA [Spirochaetota bacterium]MCX8096014.1 30S ribosome-binding factor RbfA [Spirochaetota bacterium]MDW8111809.1 30S ribosome-binding factor RbfA [Spirochaetia bacterium]